MLTGVNIEHVCNGGVSALWTRILDDIVLKEISKISESDTEQREDRNLLLQRYYKREYYQSSAAQVENEEEVDIEDEESEDEELHDEKTESKDNH